MLLDARQLEHLAAIVDHSTLQKAANYLGTSQPALSRMLRQIEDRIELLDGDSEALQFPDNQFDAAMCAYGVRNFENLQAGLTEIRRVLKPGARFVVLEFSKPSVFPVKQLFGLYFRKILPSLGRLVSSDARAYAYLQESVAAFPEGNSFLEELQKAGFKSPTCQRLTFGITSIYTATT